MTPASQAPARHDALRAQDATVLAARARGAAGIAAVTLVVYGAADWLQHREQIGVLLSIAAGQLLLLAAALRALRGSPGWRRVVVTTVGTLALLLGSGLVSDVISRNQVASPLCAVGMAVATAALFPWGAGPQAMVAALAVVTCACSLVFVRGTVAGAAEPAAFGATLLAGSVLVARAAERVRRQRAEAEAAMAAFAVRAESEARIASLLARASEVLAAHLDEPDMLDRLHTMAREALDVDWSTTLLLDPRTGGFRMTANAGAPTALREEMLQMEVPAEWVPAPGADGVIEVPDARATVLPREVLAHLEIASCVGAQLSCRGTLLGVQLHGRRHRTGPFTREARRLAVGLAYASALAIENAQRIAKLQAASALKTEFVATMSHELRTPLNVITGYTEMLADDALGPLTPEQRATIGRIRRSADELLELVNATLDVGRLEAGRVSVERQPVSVATLVAELDGELRPLLAAGVALRWHDGVDAGTVLTDRGKLKTILKNLVGNACKFTARGGIDVSATWDDGELELVVRDTGVGIPSEQLPHIFDMFRQGDGSATRRFSGVGLGLHIVRRLVELLGGRVAVESVVGRGSRFTIRLPAPVGALAHARA